MFPLTSSAHLHPSTNSLSPISLFFSLSSRRTWNHPRLDTTHDEFADALAADATREVANLWNGYGDVSENTDVQGHGTHCAGTVGGLTVGTAPGASIYGVKVLNDDGSGYTSVIVGGLEFVVEWLEAARSGGGGAAYAVASLSLGGGCSSSGCAGDAMVAAVDAAAAAGVAVTVAAGNDDADACSTTPAASTRALTIGATDSSDDRAYFSNYGTCVDLHAPGVGIASAVTGSTSSYVSWSGTSMATPHVAGALAIELALAAEDDSGDAAAEAARARLLARAVANEEVELGDLTGSPDLLLQVDVGADSTAKPSHSPAPVAEPTASPSAPTARPTACTDTDGDAFDSDGEPYNCAEYSKNPSWCGGYDDGDFTSNEMCCACGGGDNGGPTPAPSSGPTARPTSPRPTAAPVLPTPSPVSPTAAPTPSPVSPTAGPTPMPSAPTNGPTPTPRPTSCEDTADGDVADAGGLGCAAYSWPPESLRSPGRRRLLCERRVLFLRRRRARHDGAEHVGRAHAAPNVRADVRAKRDAQADASRGVQGHVLRQELRFLG